MPNIDRIDAASTDALRWLLTWSYEVLLILAAAWLALRLDRSRSAATRYRIWLVAILVVAALPLLNLIGQSLHVPVPIAPLQGFYISDAVRPIETGGQPASPVFRWTQVLWPVLFLFWIAGMFISLFRLSRSLWRVHLIRASARIISPADLGCLSRDLLGLDKGAASIGLADGIESPGLAGLFRPIILLPKDVLSWTTKEERTSILRHELAHVARRDHFVSLIQSVLNAILFFHVPLRIACDRFSLERELACDDRVLEVGAEPNAYAEVILKAAERSFLTDTVHQAASFTSRRMLERRIEMILNADRMRPPARQWPFLLLPIVLIGLCTWLVISAESSTQSQSVAASQQPKRIDESIWVDSVKRGAMRRQVRGLGTLVPAADGRLKALVQIPSVQAKEIEVGQPASTVINQGIVPGRVLKVGEENPSGSIPVELSLKGELPESAAAGLTVDGLIEIEHLDDVIYIGRPANSREGATSSLFRIDDDGATATRVQVKFGRSAVDSIEIISGLSVGDKVILSDMSAYEGVNTIKLK